jgi:shikimate kinase
LIDPETNIVLIGMPGAGKSTLGVLLARALGRAFVDSDLIIQAREGHRLQEIIDSQGMGAFLRIEERTLLHLSLTHTVLATGGSAVYSEPAMRYLGNGGLIVHLHLGLCALRRRLGDYGKRGVAMAPGQSLEDLFAERLPLYRRWADLTVNADQPGHERVVDDLIRALETHRQSGDG